MSQYNASHNTWLNPFIWNKWGATSKYKGGTVNNSVAPNKIVNASKVISHGP